MAKVLTPATVVRPLVLVETIAWALKDLLKEETILFAIAERELSGEVQEQLGAECPRLRGVIRSRRYSAQGAARRDDSSGFGTQLPAKPHASGRPDDVQHHQERLPPSHTCFSCFT